MSKYPSSVIVWEGQSQLNNQPIVLILTGLETISKNAKTGNMVQAFVIHQNHVPTTAVVEGHDEAMCGDCPLRRKVCYVNLVPVNSIHTAYITGSYPHITQEVLERAKELHKRLRITAYGDPSAVPLEVWQWLLEYFVQHTGYTHQWRWLGSEWSKFLMASCETEDDVIHAQSMGWSTFRVMSPDSPQLPGEIECPNVQNPEIQCTNCRLCSGNPKGRSKHISIEVHGLDWKVNNYKKLSF